MNSSDPSRRPEGVWRRLYRGGYLPSLAIAVGFWLAVTGIFTLRSQIVAYRPGQYVAHDITARVDFAYFNQDIHNQQMAAARQSAPHVYRQVPGDVWGALQQELMALPDRVHGHAPADLDAPLRDIFDGASIAILEKDRDPAERRHYEESVRQFISTAQQHLAPNGQPLVVLSADDWKMENLNPARHRQIVLLPAIDPDHPGVSAWKERTAEASQVYSTALPESVLTRLEDYAKGIDAGLRTKIAKLAFVRLSAPSFALDDAATAERQNAAADGVDPDDANVTVVRDMVIVPREREISPADFQILRAENDAYYRNLTETPAEQWQYSLGLALMAAILTALLAAYIARYQQRCLENHVRGVALAGLLLAMLVLTQLAGIGSSPLYLFAIAPIIVSAMILTIAYDQRFAFGVATIHVLIATSALNAGIGFFLVLWVGVITACYFVDDIRSRGKLIEVGGASALAMIIVAAAVGAVQLEPLKWLWTDCIYAGAAGLAAGFIVLGILPFIERTFRITTSMTLLELADASQPLLNRLAVEAPGTYNHSLQVGMLAEAGAEAIGANSLLCRVGSYYHDIGKINKPHYFVENQQHGANRHLNLTASLSLRIIISHVKDGVQMAEEYKLPNAILNFIRQHHGTTVVEYFYHQACTRTAQQNGNAAPVNDSDYRYPGPKPRTRESAIVMLCDAVESACRAMGEPTASRVESLVHDLAHKRLHDGQFDDSELSLRDLAAIERALTRTLLALYHGRIAYPSNRPAPIQAATNDDTGSPRGPVAKTA